MMAELCKGLIDVNVPHLGSLLQAVKCLLQPKDFACHVFVEQPCKYFEVHFLLSLCIQKYCGDIHLFHAHIF